MDKPLLSLCFWVYNLGDLIYEKVSKILELNDSRFQIVVQDNASEDNTEELLNSIKDKRLIYRRNQKNIGPLPNALESFQNTGSEYNLMVVSRDTINNEELIKFIDWLEYDKIDFGRIDLERTTRIIKYLNTKEKIINDLAYQNLHPSGYFWKQSLIDECLPKIKKFLPNKQFDFPFELIIAEAALISENCALYMYPVISPQYYFFKKVRKTQTYNKNNYFFLPNKRIEVTETYIRHLKSLQIEKPIYKKVYLKLIINLINNNIFIYHELLIDDSVKYHYNVDLPVPSVKDHFNNLWKLKRFITTYPLLRYFIHTYIKILLKLK